MVELDYEKLGFKAGLEIHQQLDTHKLFCNCPSLLRRDEPDFIIERKLHAVAGESGEVDISTAYASGAITVGEHKISKDRKFVYQGYDTNCLVELDEEPPHQINPEALKIALQIVILLNAKIMPITQIMRKTVIDGSNTSGFQRTIMIARDGWIETSGGRVRVEAIYLEEDSARAIDKTRDEIIYRLDRLGIPLVEIATGPDLKNAEQAKEAALEIGSILRSCKVKRGLGTIRQDINISIRGSNRVELKGFQDPKIMIKTIENEVNRQLNFIKKSEKNPAEVRNVLKSGASEFMRPMPGAARMYPETDLQLLKISRNLVNDIKRDLPRLKSELKEEFRKEGLSEEMIKLLFKQDLVEEFKDLLKIINDAGFVAKVLLIFPKEVASKKKLSLEKVFETIEDKIPNILRLVKEEKLLHSQVKDVFFELVSGKSLKEAISIEKEDISNIEEEILKIMKDKPGLSENAYMGLTMKKFRGAVSGKEVMEIIKKFIGQR